MSELVTIARPYAQAAFAFAIEHQDVPNWQSMLVCSAEVSRNKLMADMLSSGAFVPERLAQTFIDACGKQLNAFGQNLIRIMAEHGRLRALTEVLEQFILLRCAQEAIIRVNVISASILQENQLTKIRVAMEQRLSRKVQLNCKIDKSILAGIVIRAGDMVIDGSIRGRLDRLIDILQSEEG